MTSLQGQISRELGVKKDFNAGAEIDARVKFLVEYAKSVPSCKGFVLGISGGQDSTLAGRLAQLAISELRRFDPEFAFIAVRLPYGSQIDEDDAQLALEFINPDETYSVQIENSVDALADSIVSAGITKLSDFNKGNVKARIRMTVQYAIAGDRQMLVLGSDHAAEAVTGFFTKHGDGAADVMPLAGLTKQQGALMLQELGATERLWKKEPTADLLDDRPAESDEDALGVTYQEIDSFLVGGIVSKVASDVIENKYRVSRHKRHLPVTPQDDWWRKDD